MKNYFTVLEHLDTIDILSVDLLPKGFYEETPSKIKDSFFEYLETEELNTVEAESILQRYESQHYDSLDKIYHDLTVITIILLSKFDIASATYAKIDDFYQLAVQLLLSQASTLGNADDVPLTEVESKMMKSYAAITSTFQTTTAEALFVMGNRNTALFSSLLKKSLLDERDLQLESPFVRSKIIPQLERAVPPSNTLGNLSPALTQNQNVAHEQISTGFFHPNWYGLQASTWLKNSLRDTSLSFLPLVDGGKAVISNKLKGLAWLQQVGFKNAKVLDELYAEAEEEALLREVEENEEELKKKSDKKR